MPRVLRNYLISFAMIGLALLAIHWVNRWADEKAQQARQALPAGEPAPPKRNGPG